MWLQDIARQTGEILDECLMRYNTTYNGITLVIDANVNGHHNCKI